MLELKLLAFVPGLPFLASRSRLGVPAGGADSVRTVCAVLVPYHFAAVRIESAYRLAAGRVVAALGAVVRVEAVAGTGIATHRVSKFAAEDGDVHGRVAVVRIGLITQEPTENLDVVEIQEEGGSPIARAVGVGGVPIRHIGIGHVRLRDPETHGVGLLIK